MIKCGLCGKEFEDHQINEYGTHVQQCVAEYNKKEEEVRLKKINEELEEVKRAKVVYEGLRDAFKEKYPDVYATNFKNENVDKNLNKQEEVKPSKNVQDSNAKPDEFLDFLADFLYW